MLNFSTNGESEVLVYLGYILSDSREFMSAAVMSMIKCNHFALIMLFY